MSKAMTRRFVAIMVAIMLAFSFAAITTTQAQAKTLKTPTVNYSKSKCVRGGVKLVWNKVKGAKKYTVYLSTKQKSGFKKIGTTKSNSKVIKRFRGKKLKYYKNYYVRIVAKGKSGTSKKSALSGGFYLYRI